MIEGQDEVKNLLKVATEDNLPVLLVGETGTGKTSLVRDLADEQKKTYTRFSITGETTVDDFVGKYILKDGETVWQDGILLTAAKKGHFLVVDEINAALPEILFVLHSLLDDDKYIIVPQKDNSLIKPHKNFRFFATMNPVDEYAGTKELNKAFQSRFAMVINVEYPDRKTEVEVLAKRTGVKQETANKMVDVAIGIRRAKQEDKVFYTLSTRDLLYWGQLVDRIGIHPAFRVSVRNKGNGDGEVIEDIYKRVFTDYEKAKKDKLVMNIEFYQNERKEIDRVKKDIKAEAEKELAEERRTLQEMETRIKRTIAEGLRDGSLKARGLKSRMEVQAAISAAQMKG